MSRLKNKVEKLYNEKIIITENRIEIYKYNTYIREGNKGDKANNKEGRKGKNGTGTIGENQKEINRKKVLYRARNNIIRLIGSNKDLISFITLTYKENMQDLKKSKEHLKLLFKKLQKDYKDLKYLYVLEYQKRGAIHYHMLCNIEFKINTANSKDYKSQDHKKLELYFAKKYWSNRGFVDIRNLNQEGNTNIAKYVSTYLVEELLTLDLQGNKCYGYSRNLTKPIIRTIDTKDKIKDLVNIKGLKLQFCSNYNIHYVDKKGQDRTSKVNYFDYIKE